MDRGITLRYRCRSCRGEYQDPQPDGYRYFHACPPVRNPAWTADSPPTVPELLPRPNARNENIVEESDETGRVLMEKDPDKPDHWRSKRHIRAEGLGREVI